MKNYKVAIVFGLVFLCVIAFIGVNAVLDTMQKKKDAEEAVVLDKLAQTAEDVRTLNAILGQAIVADKEVRGNESAETYWLVLEVPEEDSPLLELEVSHDVYNDAAIADVLTFYEGFSSDLPWEVRDLFIDFK